MQKATIIQEMEISVVIRNGDTHTIRQMQQFFKDKEDICSHYERIHSQSGKIQTIPEKKEWFTEVEGKSYREERKVRHSQN